MRTLAVTLAVSLLAASTSALAGETESTSAPVVSDGFQLEIRVLGGQSSQFLLSVAACERSPVYKIIEATVPSDGRRHRAPPRDRLAPPQRRG